MFGTGVGAFERLRQILFNGLDVFSYGHDLCELCTFCGIEDTVKLVGRHADAVLLQASKRFGFERCDASLVCLDCLTFAFDAASQSRARHFQRRE